MNQPVKVLILGGNGFIGRNLAKTFVQMQGYEVTCFDMAEPQAPCVGVQYRTGDFFDSRMLRECVQAYDVIYHAVSTLTPGNSNACYMNGYERDFVQSVRLCDYVAEAGKKLIFLSSGGTVYGRHERMPVTENDFCRPINHYGAVKRCIESVMETFHVQNGARMIVARISNPYGPGQDYRKGVGVIDAAIRNAMSGTPMTVWGDGNVIRDYIYIDDACGMLAALASYEGPATIFNLSSGEGRSVNQIIAVVRELFPELQVNYTPARSVDLKEIVLDNRRIRRVYSVPLVSLEDGVHRYIDYIRRETGENERTPGKTEGR